MSRKRVSIPRRVCAAALVSLLAGCGAEGGPVPSAPARASSEGLLAPDAPLRLHAEVAGGFATSVDERGVPTFLWASNRIAPPAGVSHEDAARFHAARFATALALHPDALAATEPRLVQDRGDGGLVVHLRQRVDGLPVYGRELRLLMRPDHSLIAISGGLQPTTSVVSGAAFSRSPELGLAVAISHAVGLEVAPSSVIDLHAVNGADDADKARYQLDAAAPVSLPEGALLDRVLFPDGDRLRPAYRIEFYAGRADTTDAAAFRYLIAADTGAVLERRSLTQSDAFNYRVWVDTRDNRPLDGPHLDWTPHPTGRSDWSYPPFVAPTLVSMEGFNKNPMSRPDPWLPANAKETVGNNIDAYVDRNPPDGLTAGDFRASTTGPLTFDRVYDLRDTPIANKSQAMAATTQAFYATNWLHDYWYDSGFDERAGDAQQDNFGRGGVGHDRMRVETQDSSGRDNSNMSTPSDGLSPRMQLFIWSGRDSIVLHVTPPDTDAPTNPASFGPDAFTLEGTLSDVDDGTFPSITDACEPINNDIKGKIALVDRGNCTFKRKAINVEDAGGIGMLVVNNVDGDAPRMGNGDPMATTVTIAVLATTKQAGAKIRESMASAPVTARMGRVRDIDRDGALDDTVTFHEWGHYLHHRLADCGGAKQCAAMSEGWADFNALHSITRDGDNLDGTYAVGIYDSVQFDDAGYFGIRRQPYTTDFHKNGLTLKHIADGAALPLRQPRNGGGPNSEVHNAGEVWATMLWEVYVALQKAGRARNPSLSFDEVRRRMSEYVVVGHQMEPADATYTESRDAMVAAAGARSMEDQAVVAEAFARRGAGTCADSPPRTSETFEGVVEGFKVQPRLVINTVTLDDSVKDCDGDGVLDAGEQGKVIINVSNGAQTVLAGARVTLSTTTPGITFVGPTTFDVPDLMPYATTTLSTVVALDATTAAPGTFTLRIEPSKDAACDSAAREVSWRINFDVGKNAAASDDVEADVSAADQVWKPTGDSADAVWNRIVSDAPNHVWHGADLDFLSDNALESPDLVVSKDTFFQFRFEHRHSFETLAQGNTRLHHDGGRIEISTDGGATWNDVAPLVNPGYNGLLDKSDNPLTGKMAFVDKNAAWPKREVVTMNFLDAFAGKTVRVRFRIVTDSAVGDSGWDIDNVVFKGIDNKPFTGIVSDAGKCGAGPRGSAGNSIAGGGCSATSLPRSAGRSWPLAAFAACLSFALVVRRRRRSR